MDGVFITQKMENFLGEIGRVINKMGSVSKDGRGEVFFLGIMNKGIKMELEFLISKIKHGLKGSFYFEDGRRYQGMWKNNKMDGYGFIVWPNDDIFEGEFKDDKKEGFGIFQTEKKVFMGIWNDNKLIGNVIIIENNNIKKQYWENGKALQNLSPKTSIFFEKYADKYIKKMKNKKSK